MKGFRRYSFRYDIKDLSELVRRIRAHRASTRIVLVTLAGLFDWRVAPDARAMRIAYPISSTQNLYAYSILTRRYNEQLREFARTAGIELVDFEQYAYEHFRPRSLYFDDSVHGADTTYALIGALLADRVSRSPAAIEPVPFTSAR